IGRSEILGDSGNYPWDALQSKIQRGSIPAEPPPEPAELKLGMGLVVAQGRPGDRVRSVASYRSGQTRKVIRACARRVVLALAVLAGFGTGLAVAQEAKDVLRPCAPADLVGTWEVIRFAVVAPARVDRDRE